MDSAADSVLGSQARWWVGDPLLGSVASPGLGPTADDRTGGARHEANRRIRCLLIPLGATEQHGPHLPLATDTIIAAAWALATASRVEGAMVAPPLAYGSSGEHQSFAGTLSIGREALEMVVTELVRSAAHFCDHVVLVSGHAGNAPVLEPTSEKLTAEGHRVSWVVPRWPPGIEVDAHAGRTETSLLLHLRPDLVDPFDGVVGTTTPLSAILSTLRTNGLAAVTANGVLGDTAGATAEHGGELFDHLVESLTRHLSATP